MIKSGIQVISDTEDEVILQIDKRVLSVIHSALNEAIKAQSGGDSFDREFAAGTAEIKDVLPVGKGTTISDVICIIRGCHPERFA